MFGKLHLQNGEHCSILHSRKKVRRMKYIIENLLTGESIKEFKSEKERQKWLDENVDCTINGGCLKDGTEIDIYEI